MQQGWSAADWLQYLLSFGFVIALLLGLLWTLRKLQGAQAGSGGLLRRKAGRLHLIESLSIGPRQKLALVSVDGREVLLGITASSINALQALHPGAQTPEGERELDAASKPVAMTAADAPRSFTADTAAGNNGSAREQALNVDDENIRTWLLGKERQP